MSYIGNLPFGKTLRTVTSTTANGSATVFYPDGGYDVNFVDVYVSGVRLTSGLDYTASDGISINLLFTPAVDSTVDIVAYGLLELVSPVFPVSVTVGSNVVINTSSISVGNSTVNTQIVAGNVTLNGSTLKVGNSSVNTVITGNSVTIGGTLTVTGNVSLTTNSVNSSMLTATGVVANSYGNTTAIPVLTIDAAGRITNATTSSVSGVTGLSFAPANSTVTVSTSTTNFDAVITSGNGTVQGLLKVVDSVSNTNSLVAASANSVTTAYQLAANAVSNATSYAATAYSNAVATAASDATTKASTAYSNAVSYADTKAATAYSNAVSVAASDATTKAGTAYSNATSYADTKAATAYSNAASYADTKADTAYSNAVSVAASDATTKAATAYSNATSYAATIAGTAYSNAVSVAASDATTKAATAYSNAASYADTKAGTAYSNAVSVAASDATTKAATAYSNAISVAASDATTKAGTTYSNAISFANTVAYTAASAAYSNVFNGGTFSGAVTVQANLTANSVRMNGDLQIDGNLTVLGNTVSIYVSTLNVEDNMIYLNSNSTVSHPDLGFAGNYNDGSYAHAGLFRDATDGVWKFFHGYTPEPDASAFIDTSNTSFTLSNLQINYVIGNVTGSANSATYLGGNTATTLRSYSDTMAGTAYSNATAYADTKAGTAYSNATSYAATIAGTAYSNAVSVAASDATTKAGTAYSNATSYAATIAGTAYSNATSYAATIAGTAYSNAIAFAANASNITSGTLSASRLPATYLTAESDTLATVTARGSTTSGAMTISSGTTDQGLTMTVSDAGWNYIGFSHGATRKAYFGLDGSGNPQWGSDSGAFSITGNYTTIGTSARSPLFYDSDDTAYYLNPASSGGIALETIGEIRFKNNAGTITHFNYSNGGTSNYIRGTTYFDGSTVQFSSGNLRWSGAGYDNDDTTYYVDPNSRSVLSALNIGSATTIGSGKLSVYAGGASGVGWATGFNIGDSSNYTTWIQDAGVSRFRNLGTGGMDWYNSSASTRLLYLSDGGSFTISGDIRAPIFYDSNDTGYYVDSNSTSRMYLINANILRSYTNIYTDGDYGYGLVGVYSSYRYQGVFAMGDSYKLPTDGTTTGSLYGIAWSHPNAGGTASNLASHGMLILENGSFRGAWGGGRLVTTADVRGTIFYDYSNTGYYVDPNSVSYLNQVQADGWFRSIGTTGLYSQSYGQHIYPQSGGYYWRMTAAGNGSGGLQFYQSYDTNLQGYVYWDGAGFGLLHNGGGWAVRTTSSLVEIYNRLDAPIMYDSNNTGYYVDPNSTSYLYHLILSGAAYFRPQNWIQMDSSYGMYWPNTNGAHLEANTLSSYGSIAIRGSRNTWRGIHFYDGGYTPHLMFDGSGNGGIYHESGGRWAMYYSYANVGWGINTSTTSSGVAIYASGSIYSTGNITAYSDGRKKDNVADIKNALDGVLKLRGVTYTWNNKKESDIGYGKTEIGVIAQEVEKVFPEVVKYMEDVDEYSVAYGNITAILIEAIKEQQQQIEELKTLVNKLIGS